MLKYMVTQTLAGHADKLKAYSIAVDVLGRKASFDPASDAIVRVQAGRLRAALETHYASEGWANTLRIELPKGTYVPVFVAEGRGAPHRSSNIAETADADVVMRPPRKGETQTGTIAEVAPPARGNSSSAGGAWPAIPSTAIYVVGGLIVACMAAVAYLLVKNPSAIERASPALQLPPFNSLVIAQFASLDAGSEQQPLARALTTEIATSLTKSPLVELQLTATDIQGTGDELRQLARMNNARWALTGVLHRSGDRQRLNVFVMDAAAGRVVWSQDYDTSADDAVPEKLADAVILDLRLQLYFLAKRALEAKVSPTAVELFVLATWSPGLETNSFAWQLERVALARRAIESDARFGPAYSVLADKLSLLAVYDPSFDTQANWKEADAAARQASMLTPHSSEIAFNIALYHLHAGQIDEALRWVQRTLELAPRHTLARFWVSVLPYYCERAPDTVVEDLVQFDSFLSPANPARWQTKAWLARLHVNRGEYAAAVAAAQQSMQIVPNLGAALILIVGLVQTGDVEAARRILLDQKQYWAGFIFKHYNDVSLPRACRGSPIMEQLKKLHEDAAGALR